MELQSLISLKFDLLDLVYGTARGVSANGEQRAAIEEHITAVEARNPNPRPTEVSQRICGPITRVDWVDSCLETPREESNICCH